MSEAPRLSYIYIYICMRTLCIPQKVYVHSAYFSAYVQTRRSPATTAAIAAGSTLRNLAKHATPGGSLCGGVCPQAEEVDRRSGPCWPALRCPRCGGGCPRSVHFAVEVWPVALHFRIRAAIAADLPEVQSAALRFRTRCHRASQARWQTAPADLAYVLSE